MIGAAFLQATAGSWVPLLIAAVLTLVGTLAASVLTAMYQLRNADQQIQSNERTKKMELENNERMKTRELLNERARHMLDKKFTVYLETLKHARRSMEYWRPVFDSGRKMFNEDFVESRQWMALHAEDLELRDKLDITPPPVIVEVLPELRTFNSHHVADRNASKIRELGSPEDIKIQMELLAPQQVLDAVDAFYKALNECQTNYEEFAYTQEDDPKNVRICRGAFYGVGSEDGGFPAVEGAHVSLRTQIHKDLNPSLES